LGPVEEAVAQADLTVAAVLSGNRNFEGRIHPQVQANYLASPPLVVAYALAGNMKIDVATDPLGIGSDGKPVYLRDIWPTNAEIREIVDSRVTPEMFKSRYSNVFEGTAEWKAVKVSGGETFNWNPTSTYVAHPPFFIDMEGEPADVADVYGARVLAILGDSVTTDHISPAGSIKEEGPAGEYLVSHQVRPVEFNSYGSRRGNHEVMMRGTFANIRIRNQAAPGTEGGVTRHMPDGEEMSIFDAAMRYKEEGVPLVIVGGKEYGTGSSRDWAAKGTRLLGAKAVIVESFERIHRSNLVGMGVLPLQFKDGQSRETLKLDGSEVIDITGIEAGITPRMDIDCKINRSDGTSEQIKLLCRIDTVDEVEYYKSGGILQYVLRNMAQEAA
jgi:aconitate hydratase